MLQSLPRVIMGSYNCDSCVIGFRNSEVVISFLKNQHCDEAESDLFTFTLRAFYIQIDLKD